ncbi:MAG: alanine dehydrogenase [Bacteroidia bacterium]
MPTKHRSGFYEIAKQAALQPKEALAEVKRKKHHLTIAIPREIIYQENRVGLTPHGAQMLVARGHEVIMEAGAGLESKFSDEDYNEVGVKISYDRKEIYQADIVMKVAFPSEKELEMMPGHQTLISALTLPLLGEKQLQILMKKQMTAISFEYIRDEAGLYPVLQAMSEIAGIASITIAAEYLSNVYHGKGVMLGGVSGVPPSEVVILGAGTVGQFATRTALGLGAQVKVFDDSIYRMRRMQNDLGTRVYTSIIHPHTLVKALRTADVAIGAIRAREGRTPCIVSEEMVMEMRAGSVVVDVAIDQGGCFETSEVTNHTKPIYLKHDVIHYCVPNIPSRVSRTASYALSNIFAPILVSVGEAGGIKNYLWDKESVRHGVYVYKGNLTNRYIGEKFNISSKEIDLLIAANI